MASIGTIPPPTYHDTNRQCPHRSRVAPQALVQRSLLYPRHILIRLEPGGDGGGTMATGAEGGAALGGGARAPAGLLLLRLLRGEGCGTNGATAEGAVYVTAEVRGDVWRMAGVEAFTLSVTWISYGEPE